MYRFVSKKRVLQELQEVDLSTERNRLEAVGEAYSEDAKKKEQMFLQEKVIVVFMSIFLLLYLNFVACCFSTLHMLVPLISHVMLCD